MRITSLVAAAILSVCSWQVAAQDAGMADLEDFDLKDGQDLADLCAVDASNDLYAEAKQFCFGFLSGVVHFHDALARGPQFGRIVCPEIKVTRDEFVEMYISWARANPSQASSNNPAEATVLAALDEWGPCEQ